MLPLAHDALFRTLVGVLFLFDLAGLLFPGLPRYLGPSFNPSSPFTTLGRVWIVAVLWAAAALALAAGIAPFAAALVLAVLFRYQHVRIRYVSLARGAGAVGYMPWLVASYLAAWEGAVLLVGREAPLYHAIEVAFTIEIALVLLCAGSAKALHGYMHGPGVELALANPFWSRAARWAQAHPPAPSLRALLNRVGVGAEMLAGVLLLVPHPAARLLGALLIALVFGWVALTLRLAGLPWLMLLIAMRFLPSETTTAMATLPHPVPPEAATGVATVLTMLVWLWVGTVVVLKVGVWVLYYRPSTRASRVGRLLDGIAARVPVFVWRVFTADITNFFIRLSWHPTDGGPSRVLFDESSRRPGDPRGRWSHCAEFVALSSVFTKAKYFGRDSAPFHEFLGRYARSLTDVLTEPGLLRATWVAIDPDTLTYAPRFSALVPLPAGAPAQIIDHAPGALTVPHSRVYAGSAFGRLLEAPASDAVSPGAVP